MDGTRYSGGDCEKGKSGAILSSQDQVDRGRGEGSPTQGPPAMEHDDDGNVRDPLREANRIHCKQTRERRKQREQLLREVPVFPSYFLLLFVVSRPLFPFYIHALFEIYIAER